MDKTENLLGCIYDYLSNSMACEQCTTPRMQELEKLFCKMSDQFNATLSEEQQIAFEALMGVGFDVRSDYQESGLAAGIKLGSELHNFLADPGKFLKLASELWSPIVTAEKSSTEAMNAYLKCMEQSERSFTNGN